MTEDAMVSNRLLNHLKMTMHEVRLKRLTTKLANLVYGT